jgi:uncharacterized protein YodC (DUF2158 family)
MRVHRLEYDHAGYSMIAWFGTESEVKTAIKEHKLKPYEYDHSVVEVPTDKPGLLAWLNANVNTV